MRGSGQNRLTKAKKESDIIGDRKFVAFTGIGLPVYGKYPVRKLSLDDAEWLKENLIPVADNDVSNGYKPLPVTTTPTARESGSRTEPFGIKWKSNYRTYANNLMYRVNEPIGDIDDTISGSVFHLIKTYIRGAEKPTWSGAVEASIRAEGFYLKKQRPGTRQRTNKKDKQWHKDNATNAWIELADAGELVVLGKGEKTGKTPAENQQLQALKYAQSEKMKPSTQSNPPEIRAGSFLEDRSIST